jgi:hypothetical protein
VSQNEPGVHAVGAATLAAQKAPEGQAICVVDDEPAGQ